MCAKLYVETEIIQTADNREENVNGKKRKNKIIGETLSIFKFPNSVKEPVRRDQWIAEVPQKYWKPGADEEPRICELHFQEKDFIQESSDSNSRRKRQKVSNDTCVAGSLKRKSLRKDAYPSIWPGSPEHLSTITPPSVTTHFSSEERQKKC